MSKPTIRVSIRRPEKDMFTALDRARDALRSAYISSEMISRATMAKTYKDSVSIIREYVTIEEVM